MEAVGSGREVFAAKLGGSRRFSVCFCMDSKRHKVNELIIVKDRRREFIFLIWIFKYS